MQEEVTRGAVTLIVDGAKLSEQVFEKAVKKFLEEIQKNQKPKIYRGRQSLKQLASQNAGLANIEISDKNIKAFSRVAKKYHVDFALKKDTAAEQPRYLVFFKSRDADAITAAFQEFASRKMSREEKPSIRERLTQAKEQAAKKAEHRTIDREKVKVKEMNMKKLFLLNLPYLLFVYPFDKLAQAFRLAPGADLSGKLLSIGDGFTAAFSSPWLSFHPTDLLIGITGAVVLRMAVYLKGKNAKKYRHGIEYGSARWGTAADIAPYMDKDFFQNIPMTQTERITMASRPKQPKYARNKNILVIGGSGSGKTRFFCKPSLLQAHSSYVCADPKGTLLPEIGAFLERKKYRIKCLNLINFRKSMKYNPLAYIRSEKDILKLVNALIMNTKGEGEKSSEDFWVKAERLYYSALIGYIWYEATEEEKNFITLLDLINASEAREDDETYQSPVDLLFSQLAEREPDHFAVKQYRKFKMAAGKTLKSILISCGARLAPFDIKELRDLMEYDELELDTLGDQKTALFVILSDTDSTFNFVAALMYSQLFNLLCDKADDFYGGRLPVHVRLILDEFANIGQIPNFDKLIATIRSREISASIILQSQSQLKTIYKDAADTIVGNCDSTLFLGGKEKSTLKEISELLGKETIDLYNQSENRGSQVSHGLSYQKLGKELMTQDELAVMDGGKCIFMLRGVRPFLSDKYDLTRHPNYRYTADADPKNVFDMERYMKKQRAVVKPTDTFDVYEIDATT